MQDNDLPFYIAHIYEIWDFLYFNEDLKSIPFSRGDKCGEAGSYSLH